MKRNKTASDLRALARRAYLHPWSGRVTDTCTDEEMIAFHRMHKVFLQKARTDKQRSLLDERYPFIKICDLWEVSIPKLYLYLFAARSIIATFEDGDMQAIYNGIQSASRYHDKAVEIDRHLSPTGHLNYEDYQLRLAALYQDYQMEQLSIFGPQQETTPVM